MAATAAGKWAWKGSVARYDTAAPLGAARPAQHLQANADDTGTARPGEGPIRLAYMPQGLVDGHAGTRYDGRAGGLVDGAPIDHNADPGHDVDTGTLGARLIRPARDTSGITYMTPRVTREPEQMAGSTVAVLRGDNSLPLNNPPTPEYGDRGYPLGARVTRFVDRVVRPPRVVHADRAVPDHRAAIPQVSDSPGGARTSPFPYGQSLRTRMAQVPMTRQTPPGPLTQAAQPDVAPGWTNDFAKGF